jgi:hypothetical protein
VFEVPVSSRDAQEVQRKIDKFAQVVFAWRIETGWRAHCSPVREHGKSGSGTHSGTKREIAQLTALLLVIDIADVAMCL